METTTMIPTAVWKWINYDGQHLAAAITPDFNAALDALLDATPGAIAALPAAQDAPPEAEAMPGPRAAGAAMEEQL